MRMLPLTATALLALAGTARAETRIGVVVTGEATVQPALAAQLEGWLRERGYTLVPSPLPPDTVNTVIDCLAIEDEACAQAAITKDSLAPAVIYARVEHAPGSDAASRTLVVSAHKFETTGASKAERRTCEQCTDHALHAAAAEVMIALLGAAPVAGPPVAAPPPPPDAAARPSVLRSRRTGLGLMITGGVALATGGIFLAIDEDADSIPTSQRRFRNTAGFGVGLALAGAVVAGLGAAIFVTAPRRESAVGSPVASVDADGFVVGWSGGF